MSSLCSCAGKRKKHNLRDQDDDYYYIATANPLKSDAALTPQVKRKFPEGVGMFPNAISDLEESLVGTYKDLTYDSAVTVEATQNKEECSDQYNAISSSNAEMVVEHAFSFIDEEPEELELRTYVICSDADKESSSSEYDYSKTSRYRIPYNYEDEEEYEVANENDEDTWSVTSDELEDLLTGGVHYDVDYDESPQLFENTMNVDYTKNNRKNSCFRCIEFSRFPSSTTDGCWDIIGEMVIVRDLNLNIAKDSNNDIIDKSYINENSKIVNQKLDFRETLLNFIGSKNPEVLKELQLQDFWNETRQSKINVSPQILEIASDSNKGNKNSYDSSQTDTLITEEEDEKEIYSSVLDNKHTSETTIKKAESCELNSEIGPLKKSDVLADKFEINSFLSDSEQVIIPSVKERVQHSEATLLSVEAPAESTTDVYEANSRILDPELPVHCGNNCQQHLHSDLLLDLPETISKQTHYVEGNYPASEDMLKVDNSKIASFSFDMPGTPEDSWRITCGEETCCSLSSLRDPHTNTNHLQKLIEANLDSMYEKESDESTKNKKPVLLANNNDIKQQTEEQTCRPERIADTIEKPKGNNVELLGRFQITTMVPIRDENCNLTTISSEICSELCNANLCKDISKHANLRETGEENVKNIDTNSEPVAQLPDKVSENIVLNAAIVTKDNICFGDGNVENSKRIEKYDMCETEINYLELENENSDGEGQCNADYCRRDSSDDESTKEETYASSITTDDDSTEKLLSTDEESSSDEEHEFIISDGILESTRDFNINKEYTILEEEEEENGEEEKDEEEEEEEQNEKEEKVNEEKEGDEYEITKTDVNFIGRNFVNNGDKTIEFFRFVHRKRNNSNAVMSDSDDEIILAGALKNLNGPKSRRKSVSFDECVLVLESSDSEVEDELFITENTKSNIPHGTDMSGETNDGQTEAMSGWKDAAEDFHLLQDQQTAIDISTHTNHRDAFVIAVEESARRRLERLSFCNKLKPVDILKLACQLHQHPSSSGNGYNTAPIFVTAIPSTSGINSPIPSTSGYPGPSSRRPAPGIAEAAGDSSRTPKPPISNGHAITGAGSTDEPECNDISSRRDLRSEPRSAVSDSVKRVSEGAQNHTGSEPEQDSSQNSASAGLPVYVGDVRRKSSSPFLNGRTEVLIRQDGDTSKVRTTAIVEPSKRSPRLSGGASGRFRRRNGGGIVVVDTQDFEEPIKQQTPEEQEAEDEYNRMMMTLDSAPHREMAVDVPESFIARTKTPPRYPPPRPAQPIPSTPSVNGSAAKPVPPPRDHLKIEKDGRLVNRAPAPQVPARVPVNNIANNNNNKISVTDREPTKEQLDSIRKFQEALRKRKEEEERAAQQNEFLNRSLRGSRKLQALESHPPSQPPTGIVNDGYSSAEDGDLTREEVEDTLHRVIGYGELVASLKRLQLQLKKSGPGHLGGYTSLEGQIAAVQTLLLSPEFGRSLSVHNKVQEVLNRRHQQLQRSPSSTPLASIGPVSSHAQNLVKDCLEALQPCSLPDAAELTDLLTRYEFEGLLHAHDAIATQENALRSPSQMAAGSPGQEEEDPATKTLAREDNIKIIKIEKTSEPLGATVRNEGEAVVIGRIVRGGAADKTGLLHEGDEVLEVNGIEMRGKSINDVCDILAGMNGSLTFIIVPSTNPRIPLPPTREILLHVRAHFDYDPEDDMYIPCRELGISFQKGDVLHVISQEDASWWQAYREGEEDQTLAGLIPSRSFQHQREVMKQSVAGDRLTKEKSKKTGMLLCAKNPKKKKKKSVHSNYQDGGYPLYATNSGDEYDAEEILTYEEVALYYPRANHKRPIVLIGPPNIGRHELRQRLMEDGERFAAAVPHTSRPKKDGEIDGHDYHFISRAQFEADILARKFVEHGEYEKAYYGTSLDAIRSVVNSGKICALNLHPQSLKILRSSDLKPFVVFVAPPSLEKLRQKKIRNGEAFKEEELKDIIEKARDMEDKYGHYFDMIIINNDTDRAFQQLLNEINSLEREPQWVPASWVKGV